ncbi:excisionase family DNA-binding protein [Methylobacterium sp. P31]
MVSERNMEPLGLSVQQAAKSAGVGRTTIYEELARGRLRAKKLGRRTLILADDLKRWLEALPPIAG